MSRTITAPDPADRPQEFAELLLGLADTPGPGVLIPTTDETLEAVVAQRDELARRHHVLCAGPDVARLFLDKNLTSEVAAKAGVDAPRTACPVDEAEPDGFARDVTFPCLIKPRESYRYNRAFGVKMTRVHDRAKLREAWRRADAPGIGTLVQELIPGRRPAG